MESISYCTNVINTATLHSPSFPPFSHSLPLSLSLYICALLSLHLLLPLPLLFSSPLPPLSIMIKLQKLRVLHVSNNNIVSFPVIDYCVIESIDIHSNKLHFPPENLFTHCQRYSTVYSYTKPSLHNLEIPQIFLNFERILFCSPQNFNRVCTKFNLLF